MTSGAVKIVYGKQTDSSLAYWKDKESRLHEHDLSDTHKQGKAVAPSLWLFGAVAVLTDLACEELLIPAFTSAEAGDTSGDRQKKPSSPSSVSTWAQYVHLIIGVNFTGRWKINADSSKAP